MTLYKTILSPRRLNFNIKNEDPSASLVDYALFANISLDKHYGTVILKSIRFSVVYEKNRIVTHPYQVHLRWLNDTDPGYHPGLIVQNTVYSTVDGELLQEANMSLVKPAYSTFCQFDYAAEIEEPTDSQYNSGKMIWLNYNLVRDAVIKEDSFSNLSFELYFTNLSGQRMYRFIPNVEIEMEVI